MARKVPVTMLCVCAKKNAGDRCSIKVYCRRRFERWLTVIFRSNNGVVNINASGMALKKAEYLLIWSRCSTVISGTVSAKRNGNKPYNEIDNFEKINPKNHLEKTRNHSILRLQFPFFLVLSISRFLRFVNMRFRCCWK